MNYGFVLQKTQVDEHVFWVAKSTDLKGCLGQGETPEEAIKELSDNENEWLLTAEALGIEIPKCTVMQNYEYSGKFTVRISKDLHKKLVEQADKNSVSINSYVEEAIAEKVNGVQRYQMSKMMSLMERVCNVSSETAKTASDIAMRAVAEFNKSSEPKWQRAEEFWSFSRKGDIQSGKDN